MVSKSSLTESRQRLTWCLGKGDKEEEGSMNPLIDILDQIDRSQPYYGIIITGLYLSPEQRETARDLLTPGTQPTRAIGCFRNISVNSLADLRIISPDQVQTDKGIM